MQFECRFTRATREFLNNQLIQRVIKESALDVPFPQQQTGTFA
jgi:hypothetical protein